MYTYFETGNCPLILTVAHDGDIRLPDEPIRPQIRRWEAEYHRDARDTGTLMIALACRSFLQARAHRTPSILATTLHRAHADMNRSPEDEPHASPKFRTPYTEFHDTLDALVAETIVRFGRCLLLDLHGYWFSPGPKEYDIVFGTDMHRTCLPELSESFKKTLQRRKYRVVDSPDKSMGINSRYRGGWIVRRNAKLWGRDQFNAIQLELNEPLRTESARGDTAWWLASAIQESFAL